MVTQADRTGEPAFLARCIDHTMLRPAATPRDVARTCDEAKRYGFWGVCIPPSHVRFAASRLKGTSTKVCTVVGFPLGYSTTAVKVEEASAALAEGAAEIDMVMNIGEFKGGRYPAVASEIERIRGVCGPRRTLKVIIECCYLTDGEKAEASRLAERSGADFVKTSTGFGTGGATARDVSLIRRSLTGGAKVKAAGGIDSLAKALRMLEAGADRLGTSASVGIVEEARRAGQSRRASRSA